jgi:hypothetical protein
VNAGFEPKTHGLKAQAVLPTELYVLFDYYKTFLFYLELPFDKKSPVVIQIAHFGAQFNCRLEIVTKQRFTSC